MTKKINLRKIVSVSFSLLLIFVFVFVALSWAEGFGSKHGKRFHKRGMPPFMQKEISSFFLWRMDRGVKKLGLSEDQKKIYTAYRNPLEEMINNGVEKKIDFKKQVLSEFEKENPDLALLSNDLQKHIQVMSESLVGNLRRFNDFFSSLDEKQKSIITKGMKKKFAYHQEWQNH